MEQKDLKTLKEVADLLTQRNAIDRQLSEIIGRPCQRGHLGEYIASKIFNINLENSASAKGIDGIFSDGPLQRNTVNIKFYGKQEGFLDITLANLADYYLVLTGPKSQPMSSRGGSRLLIISNIYLFEMKKLVENLKKREIKLGTATSIAKDFWSNAEIFPNQRNSLYVLNEGQKKIIQYFGDKNHS